MMRCTSFRAVLLGGTLLAVAPSAAFAQSTGSIDPAEAVQAPAQERTTPAAEGPTNVTEAPRATPDSNQVEEVIVTARRREERLQDVPLAVTAQSGASLARQNIVTVNQLGTRIPSLTVQPGNGASRAVPVFAIRGLSQQELTILADPSVSVYLGDTVAPRPYGLSASLYDIRAVEVLRGPQGTLFGRNVTGGAIVIRPNAPTDVFSGAVSVTAGNLGTLNADAFINVPLNDWASLRVAGAVNTNDGFLYDTVLGRNINDTDTQAARISLALRPTERLDSTFVYDYFHENDGGQGGFAILLGGGPFSSPAARAARNYPDFATLLAQQQARGIYETASGVPMYTRVTAQTYSNNTSYELNDNITLRNIISGRHVRAHILEDVDGVPIPLITIERLTRTRQWSEEFQILGQTGPLNWITGLYYFNEQGSDQGASVNGAVDPGAIEPPTVFGYPNFSNTFVEGQNTSYAAFAQGTYSLDNILEGLSVTAGIRFNRDEREATFLSRTATACRYSRDSDNNPATPETVPPLVACNLRADTSFEEPTYNLSAEWRFAPDKLVYVATRHGYRTGGYGARAATEAGLRRTFNPETVDDVEFGFKADWRLPNEIFLRTNLAVYRAQYEDIQRLLTDTGTIPVTTVTANAGRARISGFEAEGLFRPVPWFEASGFWSHTNADFTEFANPFTGADLSQNPFARAPEDIWSVTGRVFLPTDEEIGQISLSATYYHTDEYSANDDFTPDQLIQAYELVSLNAEWRNVMGYSFDLNAYVNNAADEEYTLPYLSILALGFSARTPGEPRTYGLRATYRFGE